MSLCNRDTFGLLYYITTELSAASYSRQRNMCQTPTGKHMCSLRATGLLRHILSPLHNLSSATNCTYVGSTFRRPHAQYDAWRQNVLQWYIRFWGDKMCCVSLHILSSLMDGLKHSQSYLFAKYEGSNLLHHMVCIYYIHYVSPLALICVVLTML